jgi:hypothetical protein
MKMILRSVICEAIANYFESDDWKELMKKLKRGKAVRHAHVFADSILHPQPLIRIVAEYFKAQGLPLQRKAYLLPPGGIYGWTDIYNIHPRQDMGHFELIMRYNPDQVLTPMIDRPVEVWDDQYMERYYTQYGFKTSLSSQEEKDLISYFYSHEWRKQLIFMLEGTNRHVHSLVETSIHPELLNEYGVKAMEQKGWEVSKATSVVYRVRDCDYGKITYLLRKPEVMLELEWEFNPGVSIRTGAESMIMKTTEQDLSNAMTGLDYIDLDEEAIQQIMTSLQIKSK